MPDTRKALAVDDIGMNQSRALECFAALAQESRLTVLRLLIREAPSGLAVGAIARRLDILPSTLSSHLGVLRRTGLVQPTRHQREIHYAADLEGMRKLIRFLLEDCCHGDRSECERLLSLVVSD